MKNILKDLNIFSQCKKYGISPWQCPQFLFFILGIFIIFSILFVYFVGNRYIQDPTLMVLIICSITILLFIIEFFIIRSFEKFMELARLKNEFLDIVSHHLRSPLSNLNWALDLLISGRVGEDKNSQMEYFKILKDNTTRMAESISSLFIVSRLETATAPPQKKEFFLQDLIDTAIKKKEAKIKSANIKVNFQSKKELSPVIADPSQIKLVTEALLDNAIRYTPQGGKIEIKLEKKGKKLYFEIKDTGVGIPKEDHKYIFQKFFRSKNILRLQTQGLGLGLFIAKAIIKNAGGEISFFSEENKGSTFWFTLPTK